MMPKFLVSLLLAWCASSAVAGHVPEWTRKQTQQHVLGSLKEAMVGEAAAAGGYAEKTHRVGYVALGDSYGAGIGTGLDGSDEDSCRLGRHAYPVLIYSDLSGSGKNKSVVAFQWRSCTGATANDLLFEGGQIASLNLSLPVDFATLSIGGNDLGFFDVINACVFRFYSFYSGTCDSALQRAADLVASPDFETRLEVALIELLNAVKWERRPAFTIAVTGYARFFNAETEACNDASLAVFWGGPKLPMVLRAELNTLVLQVNAKLRRTVEAVNARFSTGPAGRRPKVLFVDYDAAFDGHRFCEPGVEEPDYSRRDTYFFLVGGADNINNNNGSDGNNSNSNNSPHALESSSPLVDPANCLQPAQKSGDWGMLAVCYLAMAKQKDPSLRPAHHRLFSVAEGNPGWYVPTYYGKVFHPRSLGHEVIRDAIYQAWQAWNRAS